MDLGLEGKRAIVTGGSRGIGKAVARALAAEGCDVVVAARTPEPLEAAAGELAAATGRTITPIPVDTGDDGSVRSLVERAVEVLGGVDILVNSAAQPLGQAPPPKLADVTAELFWADVNVKVLGYLRCAQAVAPHMIARGWGRIVNISGLGARSTGAVIGSMRNVAVAAMIMATSLEDRRERLDVLLPLQRDVFVDLFDAMAGGDRNGAPVRRIECKPAATWSKVTESFGRTCCDEVPSRVMVYPLGTGVLMTCVLMTTTIAP